jgi:hypothetical protein
VQWEAEVREAGRESGIFLKAPNQDLSAWVLLTSMLWGGLGTKGCFVATLASTYLMVVMVPSVTARHVSRHCQMSQVHTHTHTHTQTPLGREDMTGRG